MKNVLFVLGGYRLENEPNGNCIRKIVKYWLSNYSCCVDIICIETQNNLSDEKKGIYSVIRKRYSKFEIIENLFKIINMPLTNSNTLMSLKNTINERLVKKDYDCVISVINPAETAQALYEIKKKFPHLHTILYEIDPTSNRYKYPKNIFEKFWKLVSTRWELKIYKSFDKIIHMKTHKNHFSGFKYQIYKDKVIYLDIPGIEYREEKDIYKKNKKCLKCLYAGAFYPDLRRPDYLISLFIELAKTIDVSLDIYTNRMINYIMNLIGNNDRIKLRDVVSEDEIHNIIRKMDVLVSIGNKDSDYLPSKVLSYISTGKIIIHFYDNEEDVSLAYLRRYPKTILIDQRKNITDNMILIKNSINRLSEIKISKDFLLGEFSSNSIEYTAKKLYNLL